MHVVRRLLPSLALALVLTAVWSPGMASAAEAETDRPTADDLRRVASRHATYPRRRARRWEFDLSVPVWIPGVSGSFATGGVEVEPNRGVDDIIDDLFDVVTDLDFAFVGSVEIRRGPWAACVEAFGARLGSDITFRLTDGKLVDARIEAAIASAYLARRVWTRPLGLLGRRSCLTVDAFAGVRWYYAAVEVTLPLGTKIDGSADWLDPIVGLRADLAVGRHLLLRVKGDVGGFGVGSDFAWWLAGTLEYRFSRLFSLGVGWAVMDADYSTGGDQGFAWNLRLSGPTLIAGFRF